MLDLDNTVWGGVIAGRPCRHQIGAWSEGEAFVAFQEYLLQLKRKGVILTVCSKTITPTPFSPLSNIPRCGCSCTTSRCSSPIGNPSRRISAPSPTHFKLA